MGPDEKTHLHWTNGRREISETRPLGGPSAPSKHSSTSMVGDPPRAFRRNDHRSILSLTAVIVSPSHVPHLQWTAGCGAAMDSIHVKF